MSLIVQKFGGTSVANIERIRNVAKRVAKTYDQGNKMVVILSAMAGVTDSILSLAKQITHSLKNGNWMSFLPLGNKPRRPFWQ